MRTRPALFRWRDEHGQIIVVFAGGLVLLLAITALVVDLGFVFMLRRQEQNAADPGAVAAARYIPDGAVVGRPKMWTAACFYANQNGFNPRRTDNSALCDAAQPVDGSSLTVFYPPSVNAGAFAGNSKYVEVVVTRPQDSFFGGVVGIPKINVTSSAVAAWDDGTGGVSSLVALNPTVCSAARLHGGGGGGGVYIFPANAGIPPESGGYVQVNSNCGAAYGANDACTDGSTGALTIAGGTTVTSNKIYIQGSCNVNGGSATINCGSVGCTDELSTYVGDPMALIRPPSPADFLPQDCPTGPDGTPSIPKTCGLNGNQTLNPGTYYGGWKITGSGTTITLNAGIYILAGGGFTQTGGTTIAAASGRVLIYSTDAPVCGQPGNPPESCQDIIDFRGSTSLNLRGLDRNSPCLPYGATKCPYGGMLFWQDANASGTGSEKDVDLEGSGSLYLEGTIYSAKGDVFLAGNGLSTGCALTGPTNCAAVQVISDTWEVGGTGILNMPYDPNLFYHLPLKGLVK